MDPARHTLGIVLGTWSGSQASEELRSALNVMLWMMGCERVADEWYTAVSSGSRESKASDEA